MLNPMTGARRSTIEIVKEVLSVCSGQGSIKTAIMYRSNLSHGQLTRYLTLLFDRGLLEKNQDGLYGPTANGVKTLKQVVKVICSLSQLQKELEPQASSSV